MADITRGFVIDDNQPGWIKGWAVIRMKPWHFGGFFKTPQEAEGLCDELGQDYEVAYGSNRLGTDDFVASPAVNVIVQRG